MTKYEERAIGRMVFGAAKLLAAFGWHLYHARELHARMDDDRAAEELGEATQSYLAICERYVECGGDRAGSPPMAGAADGSRSGSEQ